jgi:hypothetical protein
VTWNVERGKRFEPLLGLLQGHPELVGADLLLLTELDIGMGRSGNRHIPRELGRALGLDWVFANFHLVLAPGDSAERDHGVPNTQGLHGAALLSRFPIRRFAAVSLPERANTYDLGTSVGLFVNVVHKLARYGFDGTVRHYMTPEHVFERRTFDVLRRAGLDIDPYTDPDRGSIYYDMTDPELIDKSPPGTRSPVGRRIPGTATLARQAAGAARSRRFDRGRPRATAPRAGEAPPANRTTPPRFDRHAPVLAASPCGGSPVHCTACAGHQRAHTARRGRQCLGTRRLCCHRPSRRRRHRPTRHPRRDCHSL